MATYNSTTYEAQTSGKLTLDQGVQSATLHMASTTYEADAAAAADVINLFKLPDNVVIQDIKLYFDALGTGVTLDAGDSVNAARYLDGISAAAAGASGAISIDGLGYRVGSAEGDDLITLTIGGAAATGTIKAVCVYSM